MQAEEQDFTKALRQAIRGLDREAQAVLIFFCSGVDVPSVSKLEDVMGRGRPVFRFRVDDSGKEDFDRFFTRNPAIPGSAPMKFKPDWDANLQRLQNIGVLRQEGEGWWSLHVL